MKKSIISLFALIFLLGSCKKTPLLNDVEIISNTAEIMHTSLALTILNAKTQELMGLDGTIVRARITGQDADDVFDISGQENDVFVITKGLVSFGIYSDREPTPDNPLKFNVVLEAGGYVTTSVPVHIYEKGRTSIDIGLIEKLDTPEGVSYKITTMETTNGVLNEDETMVTDVVSGTNTRATLFAPQGLVIKDENGAPLSGNLVAELTYFNNEERNFQSYPGGMIAEVQENGESSMIEFYSAGFVAVTIRDDNGKQARFFENGTLDVEIEIASDTYNPVTGGPVQDGDVIPIWSYEVEDGVWDREEDVTITTNTSGQLVAKAEFEHLSYWNWDWKAGACWWGSRVFLKSNVDPDGTRLTLRMEAIRCSNNQVIRTRTFSTFIGDFIRFVNVPAEPILLRVYRCDVLVGEIKINNLCDNLDYDLFLNQAAGGDEVVSLSVNGYCPNGAFVRPTFPFWYRNLTNQSCSYWTSAWFINGEADIRVTVGHMYRFVIYYNGRWIEHDAIIAVGSDITCENLPFSTEMCNFF